MQFSYWVGNERWKLSYYHVDKHKAENLQGAGIGRLNFVKLLGIDAEVNRFWLSLTLGGIISLKYTINPMGNICHVASWKISA